MQKCVETFLSLYNLKKNSEIEIRFSPNINNCVANRKNLNNVETICNSLKYR